MRSQGVDPGMTINTKAIRVFVVDDHPVVVQGVNMLVRGDPRLQVVGDARSAGEALRVLPELSPDVVLLDLRLPDMLASESARRIRALLPTAKILVFTAHAEHPALQVAMESGAHGVLLKDVANADLVDAIIRVFRGETVLDPRLVPDNTAWHPEAKTGQLTKREYEILRRVAMGETNPEIAENLMLSRNTVKTYLQSALQKLGARNRIDAIVKAGEAGIL
jgi:DNA-binding NarL/FixJ family response regulator